MSTRYCAGITSSRDERSSPITCIALPQHRQAVFSGSMTISTRGRCSGSEPRPARRVSARARFSAGSAFSCWASVSATACSTSSSARLSWSGSSFSERRPNCRRCSCRIRWRRRSFWWYRRRAAPFRRARHRVRPRPRRASRVARQHRSAGARGPGAWPDWTMQSAVCGLFGEQASQLAAAHPATLGRGTLGAYMRRQSIPSNRAASCAPDRRITPSLTGGHLNVPPSSRFQISTRPVPS